MIRNHNKSAVRFQNIIRLHQHFLQYFEFLIHFDSNCLKNLREKFVLFKCRNITEQLLEILRGFNRFNFSVMNNFAGQFSGFA